MYIYLIQIFHWIGFCRNEISAGFGLDRIYLDQNLLEIKLIGSDTEFGIEQVLHGQNLCIRNFRQGSIETQSGTLFHDKELIWRKILCAHPCTYNLHPYTVSNRKKITKLETKLVFDNITHTVKNLWNFPHPLLGQISHFRVNILFTQKMDKFQKKQRIFVFPIVWRYVMLTPHFENHIFYALKGQNYF